MIDPRLSGPPESLNHVVQVLNLWRSADQSSALHYIDQLSPIEFEKSALLFELRCRCHGFVGPRLLVDGLWFVRSYGGISRVWEQILQTLSIPGMCFPDAPVSIIDRHSCLAISDRFPQMIGSSVDPLNWCLLPAVSDENSVLCSQNGADVFVSSWISSSGHKKPVCSELALVHDCIPDRMPDLDPSLRSLRRRWLVGASDHLAVSASTAADLSQVLGHQSSFCSWCHPCTIDGFDKSFPSVEIQSQLFAQLDLPAPYVLLPATAGIGTYKNPELLLSALSDCRLGQVHLVLCGRSSLRHVDSFCRFHPSLEGRVHGRVFNDFELRLAYQGALAVVVPSRFEGFGLPVIEALAANSVVITTDVPGLREAASGAVPTVGSGDPQALADWLSLLLDPSSLAWLRRHLERRRRRRMSQLHPDLLGLSLLSKARRLASSLSR